MHTIILSTLISQLRFVFEHVLRNGSRFDNTYIMCYLTYFIYNGNNRKHLYDRVRIHIKNETSHCPKGLKRIIPTCQT